MSLTDRVGDLRFRLPQALDPYSGTYNATAFGLSCTQQAARVAIPNGIPQETVEFLTSFNTSIPDSEDCEEAVVEASRLTETNSDDDRRFNAQCCCARPRRIWFSAPGCSGVYSMYDIPLPVLIERSAV